MHVCVYIYVLCVCIVLCVCHGAYSDGISNRIRTSYASMDMRKCLDGYSHTVQYLGKYAWRVPWYIDL
jgi:hypothetical protein